MTRIEYVFCHGQLARIREIQNNISPITVDHMRQTPSISCKERKRQVMWMAHSEYVFNEEDDTVLGSDNEWCFYRKYNIWLLPIITIN
jgi:hypothetical protein